MTYGVVIDGRRPPHLLDFAIIPRLGELIFLPNTGANPIRVSAIEHYSSDGDEGPSVVIYANHEVSDAPRP
jgi:hypothetical protein